MADGSIVFDTKIKTDNVKPQLEALKTRLASLNAQLKTADSNRNKIYNAWEKSGFKDNGLREKLSEADGEAKRLREDIERVNEAISMTKSDASSNKYAKKPTAGEAVDGISDVAAKAGADFFGPKNLEGNKKQEELKTIRDEIGKTQDEYNELIEEQKKLAAIKVDPHSNEWQQEQKLIDETKAKLQKLVTAYGVQTGQRVDKVMSSMDKDYAKMESKAGKYVKQSEKGSFVQRLKNGFSTAGNTVKGFLDTMKGGNKGLDTFNGRLKTGIGTVLKYALGIRSLYVLFNRLRQFLSAGIGNLQQYSQQTANSINALQTSATFAGNALAAAFEPILSAVVPILTTLIDALATACNWIARFFAMIGGQKTYTKAVKGANQYAKATKGVGSAAKKAADAEKGQLAAIDEINDITSQSPGSGGGGGGGGGGADIGSMFETAQVAGDSVLDAMKKAIENGDWEGAGKILADKVNSMFASVDWAGAGKNFGTGLAHVIQLVYGFLENLDTHAIGADLAAWVNGAIEGMDWNTAGALLVRGFTAAIDFVMGFFGNLDYAELAQAISSFLEGALDEVTNWLTSKDWSSIGEAIVNGIVSFFTNVDWSGLALSIASLLGAAIKAAIDLVWGMTSIIPNIADHIIEWWNTDIEGANWQETANNLWNAFKTAIGDVGKWVVTNIVDPFMDSLIGADRWNDMKQAATDIWNGFTEGLKEFFDNPVSWIKQHMIDPLVDGVKDLLGIHSPSTVFREIGTNIIDGLKEGLDNAWKAVSDFFTNGFNSIKDFITETWGYVKENTSETWNIITDKLGSAKDAILNKWQNTKDWFNDTVISPVKDRFSDLGGNIKTYLSDAKENVESGWSTVTGFFSNVRTGINDKFSNAGAWFRSIFNNAKDNLINGFNRSSISWHVSSIASDISGTFGGLASQAWSWGSDMVNGMKNGINYAKQAVVNAARNVANGIKSLLHFSRPDTGPLRDYEQWMPDMMDGLANGIESNIPVVNRAMSKLADSMSTEMKIMPEIPDLAAGKVLPAAFGMNFRADSQKEVLGSMKDLADAFNSFGGNEDVVSAINTLIAVVREKKLLASDVGAAAVDYMNAEYDRTGEPVLKGV